MKVDEKHPCVSGDSFWGKLKFSLLSYWLIQQTCVWLLYSSSSAKYGRCVCHHLSPTLNKQIRAQRGKHTWWIIKVECDEECAGHYWAIWGGNLTQTKENWQGCLEQRKTYTFNGESLKGNSNCSSPIILVLPSEFLIFVVSLLSHSVLSSLLCCVPCSQRSKAPELSLPNCAAGAVTMVVDSCANTVFSGTNWSPHLWSRSTLIVT